MFNRHLQQPRYYIREYTIRGVLNGKPVELVIRGLNAMDAVNKAIEDNVGLQVKSIQVNKEL